MRDEASAAGVGEEALRQFDLVEIELKALDQSGSDSDQSVSKAIELMIGMLFVTLILGLTGGAATLTALARGSGSDVIFLVTVTSLAWMAISLISSELLLLTSRDDRPE